MSYEPGKVVLYEHQVQDLAFMREKRRCGLWHEVGSGKTLPTIFLMRDVISEARPALVVVPLSLMGNWVREMDLAFPGMGRDAVILSGGLGKAEVARRLKRKAQVILVNYDYVPSVEKELLEKNPSIVVADEAHRLKGFRSMRATKHGKRAKSIMAVSRKADYRVALSGSPIINGSEGLFGLYYFIDERVFGPVYWKFIDEFFYDLNRGRGMSFPMLVLKPHMKEHLSERMYSVARRLLKSELPVTFPEVSTILYHATMGDELAKAYHSLREEFVALIGDTQVAVPHLLTRLMALQMLSGGFIKVNGEVVEIDSSHKRKLLTQVLDEIEGEPCIIWAHFRHEFPVIERVLVEYKRRPGVIHGGVGSEERQKILADFDLGKLDTLLCQPGAAGEGLNLQRAGYSIRWSRSHSLKDYLQSIGRIHRPNSPHKRSTYCELLTADTVDVRIHKALETKEDLSATICLDDFKERRS